MSQEPSTILASGTVLDGKFKVCQEIGHGGMATVYEAENVDIGKRVAIKVLSPELANSAVVTERFMREARAAAKIRSPYICDVYDVGTFNDRPFLVMELLEGESLYERLSRERRLSIEETIRIATETGMGLAQAHEANIVHRDLKPENIFLTRSGGGEQCTKIVDFGLAKFYEPHLEGGESARLTKAGALFGTPAYMSPEQASAQGPVNHRTDLWAFGCIVYEMLVGRTVWNVDQGVAMILAQIAGGPLPTPTRVRTDLPPGFDKWFLRALARKESERFADAKEMAEALRVALQATPTKPLAPPPSAAEGSVVDALVRSGPPGPPSAALKPLVGPSNAIPRLRSSLPARLRNSKGKWITGMLTAVALTVLGLLAWNGLRNPDKLARSLSLGHASQPVELAGYAQQLAVGQEQLSDGQFQEALASFEGAFINGESKAARSLRSHAKAIEEAEVGPCRVRGLGHPRPFDSTGKSSRPSLAWSGSSLIYSWATSAGEHLRPIEITELDFALRRVAPVAQLTPDSQDSRDPQLVQSATALGLLYTSAQGKVSSVQVRLLDPEGTSAGPAHLLSSSDTSYAYDPHMVGQPGDEGQPGMHWALFSQATHRRVHDLFLRSLDPELVPNSKPIQLTAYAIPKRRRRAAALGNIGATSSLLTVAFREQRGLEYHVEQLSLQSNSIGDLGAGVSRDSDLPNKKSRDQFAGNRVTLSKSASSESTPRVGCTATSCYTVWSDDKEGAHVALANGKTGAIVWAREFGTKGARPSVGIGETSSVVVWYQDSRVLLASLGEDGVGEPTVVARVGGLQPPPEVVPGKNPGEWYVAWRAFEAASLEPFVAQVNCQ